MIYFRLPDVWNVSSLIVHLRQMLQIRSGEATWVDGRYRLGPADTIWLSPRDAQGLFCLACEGVDKLKIQAFSLMLFWRLGAEDVRVE